MARPKVSIHKYWVAILAFLVICVHFLLVKTWNLNRWKGGGFGMYSEVHYYLNDLVIDDLITPLDSLILKDKIIANHVRAVKRIPNAGNLKKMAEAASKYVSGDTVTIQVWKPLIDSKNSTYSRELATQYQFIKP